MKARKEGERVLLESKRARESEGLKPRKRGVRGEGDEAAADC